MSKKIGSRAMALLLAVVLSFTLIVPETFATEIDDDDDYTIEIIDEPTDDADDIDNTQSDYYIIDTETGDIEDVDKDEAMEIIDNADEDDFIIGDGIEMMDIDDYVVTGMYPGYTADKETEAQEYFDKIVEKKSATPMTMSAIQTYSGSTAYVDSEGSAVYGGGTASGNRFVIDGHYGYCVQPSLVHPTLKTSYTKHYNVEDYTYEGTAYSANLIRKALWYGYGGPGFDASYWPSTNYLGNAITNNDLYYANHVLLADWFWYDAETALNGTSDKYKQWAKDYVIANIVDGVWTGNYTQTTRWKLEMEAPDPPDSFIIYCLNVGSNSTQVLVGWEYTPSGELQLLKTSGNETITANSPCYSLKDAVYGVYNNDACQLGTEVATLTTKSDGSTDPIDIDAGTYWVKEITASKGYELDEDKHSVTVSSGETATVQSTEVPGSDPITLKITKEGENIPPTGAPSLAGAQFEISYFNDMYYSESSLPISDYNTDGTPIYKSTRTWVIESKLDEYQLETYGITKYTAQLTDDYLIKDKSTGDLYKANGQTTIPYGTILIREIQAPTGYANTGSWNNVSTDYILLQFEADSGPHSVSYDYTRTDPIDIWGGVAVPKIDADRDYAVPQGDATLADAEYTVYYNNSYDIVLDGKTYKKDDVAAKITTDEDGHASTGAYDLLYGSYYIVETKASKGYLLNTSFRFDFDITENGVIVNADGTVTAPEYPQRGGIGIYKYDVETYTMTDEPQGDADLANAQFTIRNVSAESVVVKDGLNGEGWKTYEKGEDVMTISTDRYETDDGAFYYAHTAERALPYGTYEIRETASPEGYLLGTKESAESGTTTPTYTFKIEYDGQFDDNIIYETPNKDKNSGQFDQVIRGGVIITKRDLETGYSYPLGGADLKGAEFTIYNESKNAVYIVDGVKGTCLYQPGEEIFVLTTEYDEDAGYYVAKTGPYDLPYGSYRITETKSPDGYLPFDQHKQSTDDSNEFEGVLTRTFEIREDGKYADLTDDGYDYNKDDPETSAKNGNAIYNQVIRGDFSLRKINEGQQALDSIIFKITAYDRNGDEIEHHYFMTDSNGGFSSMVEYTNHTYNTNAVDYYYENEFDGTDPEAIPDSSYSHCGIWFGIDAPVRNDLGALPYGKYTIEEMPSGKANAGLNLWSGTINVTSYDNNQDINLGDIVDAQVVLTTSAEFEESGSHYTVTSDNTIAIDSVHTENLTIGQQYTIVMKLFDVTTGEFLKDENGEDLMSATTFTPSTSSYTVETEIDFDSLGLDGENIVVYEYIYEGTNIDDDSFVREVDPTDESQTLYFPAIGTSATDSKTGINVSYASTEITIIDTIEYNDVRPGRTYTVEGILMNANTGEPALDSNGNQITSSTKFKAEDSEGTVEVTFVFDGSLLEGETVVVFEDLYYNNDLYATHSDITDQGQTVYIPKIHTQAWSSETDDQISHSDGFVTIYDNVTYTSLAPYNEYTLYSVLLNAETHEIEVDPEGEPIVGSYTFIPTEADGEAEVAIVFDASEMSGHRTVFYEVMYMTNEEGEDQLVAIEDVADAEYETVYFPEIHTNAISDLTEDNVTMASEEVTIIDTVTYTQLQPGQEYTLEGVLMNQETGEPLLDSEGNEIISEVTFVPEDISGTIDVEFTFDASLLAGTTTVVFEELVHNDVTVALHMDIDDEGQTVYIPKLHTTAIDSETENHIGQADEDITIIDTIEYTNLKPGVEYTVSGVLMNQKTNEPILDADGEEVVSETTFTPETPDGFVTVAFNFNGVNLAGETIVVFEDLLYKEIEVAVHADIDDDEQTVFLPDLQTTAIDDETGDHVSFADDTVTIIDTVEFTNVIPGEVYTVSGTLMNANTGEPLLNADDEYVTSVVEFITEDADGSIDVEFTFDASDLAGTTTVVFEDLLFEDETVAVHEDLTDEGQTVYIPDLHTTALDSETEDHISQADGEITIIDTVEYTNLKPGEEYTVTGVLMDKESQSAMTDDSGNVIYAETTFTPEEADGTVDVTFTFSGTSLAGKTLVAFEEVTYEDIEVATHADIDDEDQTVYVPDIHTTAISENSGTHTETAEGTVTIVDTVEYTNLIPGVKYTMRGELMNADGGGQMGITASTEFTPEEPDGSVDVTFKIDASNLGDTTIVVFEYCELDGNVVGEHTDLSDTDQQVNLIAPPETENPTSSTTTSTPKTGDPITMSIVGVLAVAAIAGVGVTLGSRKRKTTH